MIMGDESEDYQSSNDSVLLGEPEESLFSENPQNGTTKRVSLEKDDLTDNETNNLSIKYTTEGLIENKRLSESNLKSEGELENSFSKSKEEVDKTDMASSAGLHYADELSDDEYFSYTEGKKPLEGIEANMNNKVSTDIYQFSKEPLNDNQTSTPARSKFLVLSSNTGSEPNRAMRLDQVADRIYAAVSPTVDLNNKKEYINYLRLAKSRLQEMTKDAKVKVFCATDTPKDLAYFFETTVAVNIRTDSPPELAKFVNFCDMLYDWLAQPTNQIALIHTCGDFSRLLLLLLAYTNYYEKIDKHEVKTILSLKSYINAHCIFMTNLPASFRRYAAYMSRCSLDRMNITKASVSLHALVLYSFPVMEKAKNMACKLFFKVYTNKPMKSVHTTRVYCLPAVVNRLVILFDNAPVTLNNDVMIVCYHKSDSLPTRKRILKLIFNTCEVTSDICSFERRDFDEVYDAAPLKMKLDLYFKATAAFGQDQQDNLMIESDFEETVRIRDSFENLRDSILYSTNSYKSKQSNLLAESSSSKTKVTPKALDSVQTGSPKAGNTDLHSKTTGQRIKSSLSPNNSRDGRPRNTTKITTMNSSYTSSGPPSKPSNRYYNSTPMVRDQQDSQDLDRLLDDLKSEGKKYDDSSLRQEMLSEKEKRLMQELIQTKRELALMQRSRSVTNEPRASQYLYTNSSTEQSPARQIEINVPSGRRSTSVEPRPRHTPGQSWRYGQQGGMLTSACSFHALSPQEQSTSIEEAINNLDRAIATLPSPDGEYSTRTKMEGNLSLKNVKLRAASMKHLPSTRTQAVKCEPNLTHSNIAMEGEYKNGRFPVEASDYNQVNICPIRTHSQTNVTHLDVGRGFLSKYNISAKDSNIHSSMPKRRENLSLVSNYSAHREQLRHSVEQPSSTAVIEDIETITLQPIGKGVQDLNAASSNKIKENSNNNAQSALQHQTRSLPREITAANTEMRTTNGIGSPVLHGNGPSGGNVSAPLSPGATSIGLSRASSMGSSVGHITCEQVTLKHVQLTTKIWYQPYITRDEAIAQLKDQPCGTFIVRDSNTFTNSFGLAVKVPFIPSKMTSKADDTESEVVRHYLIEPVVGTFGTEKGSQSGVRLKGFANEPIFPSLAALIYQHALLPLALPCRLLLPGCQPSVSTAANPSSNYENITSLMTGGSDSVTTLHGSIQHLKNPSIQKTVNASCVVLYLGVRESETSGSNAIKRTIDVMVRPDQQIRTTECLLKASPSDGIILIDNLRKLFVKRNFPSRMISYAGLDPKNRGYDGPDVLSRGLINARLFGFVTKRHEKNKKIYTTHILCEIDPSQPSSALVKYITKKVIGR